MTLQAVNELIASLESAGELSIREQKFLKLAKAYQQLAAENVALNDGVAEEIEVINRGGQMYCVKDGMSINPIYARGWNDHRANVTAVKTPATDRIVAGIKADGRAEGINFAASRLAAAFNHGFVDKPMAEVGDVVRMILTAKEDLANDPVLAADGLSGEYAEKSLAEWEAALSEGASYD
ncbi:TPA: hypothetical protein ACRGGK_002692 [Klebsiella pneumoniae]